MMNGMVISSGTFNPSAVIEILDIALGYLLSLFWADTGSIFAKVVNKTRKHKTEKSAPGKPGTDPFSQSEVS